MKFAVSGEECVIVTINETIGEIVALYRGMRLTFHREGTSNRWLATTPRHGGSKAALNERR